MTRDTWDIAKARLATIFSRHRHDGDQDITGQLEITEERLRTTPGSLEPAVAEERQRWAAILTDFLGRHGEAAPELREFVREVRQLAARDSFTVVQRITARRDAYTAGRDQHITSHPHQRPDPHAIRRVDRRADGHGESGARDEG
ncbi:hypothetical protein DQ384_34665 [Sphaerisporangium album]|uniref:Uncharacterized protein n=2 Tax=Sphaerisporangium album TaxID=509200 RepID=A0A367EXM5_9ACTN|nr:hypothetical protein DQ384_34665 [Sphaerisporangium album]